MSFYDSASLVFLPSGGAGKDGKAYSMKPVPEYGNELVTNGGFDTDSDWTKDSGWSIENGQAICNGVGINSLQQTSITTTGKIYKLSFDVLDSNNFNFLVISTNFGDTYVDADSNNSVVIGTNTFYIEPTNGTGIRFRVSNGTTLTIDNVSVKEVVVGDGDFTFSRGSNLTATRVDSNGLIEKGRENLLTQSNQFDTTWLTLNASVTSGQSGYDGSNNAWLLENTGSSGRVYQTLSTSGVLTYSVYAKAGNVNWMALYVNASPYQYIFFDLANVAVGNDISGSSINATITDKGSGWVRCSVSLNPNGNTTDFRVFPAFANGNLASSGQNIYIQDAQLEQGLVATEYIESGATTGKAGILEDSPRFDYSGGASCPSLLLEPSRTNLITSEYFEGWNLFNNMTPTANDAISPEGLQNAYKMETTAAGAYFRDAEFTSTGSNVFSIFAKKGNAQYIFLASRFFNGFTDTYVWFDVENGTKGGINGESFNYGIEDYGNGWYRCYLVHDVDASDLFGYCYVGLTNTDLSISSSIGLNGYFYGGQWEAGSYPTSYIPNHSGGSVTRNGDSFEKTGLSSVIGQAEGTIFFEIPISNFDGDQRMAISDGTSSNRIALRIASGGIIQLSVVIGGATQASVSGSGSINNTYKIALVYKRDYFKIFINGTLEGTDTSGTLSGTFNRLATDRGDGSQNFYNSLSQLLLFPTALSNTDCEILTGTSYESFAAMATALNYTTYE